MKNLMIVLILIFSFSGQAQNAISEILETVAEESADRPGSEEDLPQVTEELSWLMEHPVNINSADEEELSRIPGFTDKHVDDLIRYRTEFGKIFTPFELRSVDGFDSLLVVSIMPFILCGEEPAQHPLTPGKFLRYGRKDLILRYQRVTVQQAGYSDENGKGYAGDPSRMYFRYSQNYYNRMMLGIMGEKDPGEKAGFANRQYGMDYYSGYFCLQDAGPLRKLVIGNYRADFGQGLVLGTGTVMGSVPGPAGIRNAAGIRPSLSSDENDYLRGIGLTLGGKRFAFTGFWSLHRRDANITAVDSLTGEPVAFSSFGSSGYHRTASEIADRNSIREQIAGGNISFRNRFLKAGITGFYSRWNAGLAMKDEPYRKFSFRGNENLNAGLDMKILLKGITFYGEAGISMNGAVAFLGGFEVNPDPRLTLGAGLRNYPVEYQNLRSNATGRNGDNSNEQGISASFNLLLPFSLTLSGYLDVFRFPYLKYRINNPSAGSDFRLELIYNGIRDLPMYVRFRCRSSETGVNGHPAGNILRVIRYSLRYQNDWNVSPVFSLKSRIEAGADARGSFSWLLSQSVSVRSVVKFVSLHMIYALFDTRSYEDRMYMYENDVLYGYSVPALAGKGLRFMAMISGNPLSRIDIWLRYACTWYAGRNSISSGLSEVSGNLMPEVKVQVRIRF